MSTDIAGRTSTTFDILKEHFLQKNDVSVIATVLKVMSDSLKGMLALLVYIVSLLRDQQNLENMVKHRVCKLISTPIPVGITDSARFY